MGLMQAAQLTNEDGVKTDRKAVLMLAILFEKFIEKTPEKIKDEVKDV